MNDPTLTHNPTVPARAFEVSGYELLGELGRGGMGVVYKARQVGIGRIVALKVVSSGDPEDLARFRTDAESIGRARHPNIVEVFEVGDAAMTNPETDERLVRPYFSLEYCEGGSLDKKLNGTPMANRPRHPSRPHQGHFAPRFEAGEYSDR